MITYYIKSQYDKQFVKIEELQAGAWINIENATTDDLKKLEKIVDLEMPDLIDSLDSYEIPRVESDEGTIVVYVRNPSNQSENLFTELLTIILTADYIITISPNISPMIAALFDKPLALQTTMRAQFMLYILLKVTGSFTAHIKRIQFNVLKTKGQRGKVDSNDILSLTKSEEILNQYQSTLVPLRNTLQSLSMGRYLKLYENDRDLLDDLLNAIKQCEDICDVNLKSIQSLRNCYQIIFTNSLNKTIKLLTALTIIFTIPTIIASLYGMNVDLPFAKDQSAFIGIIVVTLILSMFATMVFHWRKWL